MASTTKIMTCILALEKGNLQSFVTASRRAVAQPEVKLFAWEGQQFRMEDLLYSMMLESHNDSAVMIAEHLAGSVEAFAACMNQKAVAIGCTHTHFVTPNGLDEADQKGPHRTTAEDLCRLMKYCTEESGQKEAFLRITGTQSYDFTDRQGKGSYHCQNHNALLHLVQGAFSGKTGFTNDAGYCYVGAAAREGKKLIVALLGSGWPGHRGYKWMDTEKLMKYGFQAFTVVHIKPQERLPKIFVEQGFVAGKIYGRKAGVPLCFGTKRDELAVLQREGEGLQKKLRLKSKLEAPLPKGKIVGKLCYMLGVETVGEFPVMTEKSVEKRTFHACLYAVYRKVLL